MALPRPSCDRASRAIRRDLVAGDPGRRRTECTVHHARVPEIAPGGDCYGRDPQADDTDQLIGIAARCSATVLISDGNPYVRATLARLIHQESACRESPFILVNGQHTADWRPELSFPGSLYLEEAQDLSSRMQARLLGILDGRSILPVTPRVMAGATSDLFLRVRSGAFSSELFYRLNVIHLVI